MIRKLIYILVVALCIAFLFIVGFELGRESVEVVVPEKVIGINIEPYPFGQYETTNEAVVDPTEMGVDEIHPSQAPSVFEHFGLAVDPDNMVASGEWVAVEMERPYIGGESCSDCHTGGCKRKK